MKWTVVSLVLLFGGGVAAEAWAQGGNGSLRGIVKDAQGGALPGVTMTATSPALLGATSAVSDADGNYRVINLPPGVYALTAELTGFAVFRREEILLRAGANFQVGLVSSSLTTIAPPSLSAR